MRQKINIVERQLLDMIIDCASYIQYDIGTHYTEIHATKKLRDEKVLLKNYGLKQILT